jgi:aminodeoxychorismate lyase
MIVCLNGEFVPEEKAVVSVFDRSFLYGDGLFETIRIFRGIPFRWENHFERLQSGAHFLGLRLPRDREEFAQLISALVTVNKLPDALARLTVSRGVGRRGYSPEGADTPFFVIALHPRGADAGNHPKVWKLAIASLRLPAKGRLAHFKTCNKLAQILARREAAESGVEEAVLLNTNGEVVEGSGSNLFWVEAGAICTAPIESGLLPGVTRAVIRELCPRLGISFQEKKIGADQLVRTDGVFLSLTSQGIVECGELGGIPLRRSPLTQAVFNAYRDLLQRESALA